MGTLPGDKTLKENEKQEGMPKYYCDPSNRFWKIIASLNGMEIPPDNEDRVALLKSLHIALWDVYKSADREGSTDGKMRNTHFDCDSMIKMLREYPNIKIVFFNGKRPSKVCSERYRNKIKGVLAPREIVFSPYLPSTSRANTSCSEKVLIDRWQKALRNK